MTAEEKEKLLKQYHPDYKTSEFAVLKVGANSGEEVPHELCEMLQAHSPNQPCEIDLEKIDYDVDVLVIGGGGAGASAAIEAHNAGANTMIVTKLRIGDANTMMAEGGIQGGRTSRMILLRFIFLMHTAEGILQQSANCSKSWYVMLRVRFSG